MLGKTVVHMHAHKTLADVFDMIPFAIIHRGGQRGFDRQQDHLRMHDVVGFEIADKRGRHDLAIGGQVDRCRRHAVDVRARFEECRQIDAIGGHVLDQQRAPAPPGVENQDQHACDRQRQPPAIGKFRRRRRP